MNKDNLKNNIIINNNNNFLLSLVKENPRLKKTNPSRSYALPSYRRSNANLKWASIKLC